MAEPAGVVTTTLLAYPPAPCPALDAILADDEYGLPTGNGQPLPDGRVQQRDAVAAERDAFKARLADAEAASRRGPPQRHE